MSNNSILITFGCSWTFGIGAGYEDGMDQDFYEKNIRHNSELNWEYSWRKIVSEYFNVKNLNFSAGGSSNQRQFKEARNFFISEEWNDILKVYDNIIILWGITSTTRNYMYCRDLRLYKDLYLNLEGLKDKNLFKNLGFNFYEDKLAIALAKWSYDEEIEIENLEQDIIFFNKFLSQYPNVKNFWFDTFNHHSYTKKIENFIDYDLKNRDLLSYLLRRYLKENNLTDLNIKYWEVFEYAKKFGVLNPFSFHPKKESYKKISEYFISKLKPYFSIG